ncbi:hypothetical protein PybrP1_008468 [[Pythium] brassicae (nom. inval.)]|nr:hypothetical protein PybrP1_008468 [[Pythium] brassicae (nom. inval.)]
MSSSSPPAWFQSPAPQPPRSPAFLPTRAPARTPPIADSDSDDDDRRTAARLLAGGYGDDGGASSDSDGTTRHVNERSPLLSGATAGALSPSTGSASQLRRSFRGGARAKRGCTDVLFLGLFAAYWAGMVALGVVAFTRESSVGFAKYIQDGVDFSGRACGAGRFVYFPDFRANPDFGFCVDACPAAAGQDLVVQLPLAGAGRDDNGSLPLQPVTFKSYATHAWTYACAPAEVKNEAVMIAQLQDTIGRFVGALGECWQVLSICCGVTLVLATLYLVFLRYCGCFTVFLSAVGIQGILAYASYRLLVAASNPAYYSDDPAMRSSLQLGAVVLSCSAILFLVLAFSMLPRLILGAGFITHASRALSQLKKLLVVPFISYALLILLFWWGISVTVCLFSAGETSSRVATVAASSPPSVRVETESFRVDTRLRWLFLYHAWGIYWTATFVLSIGEMITATAVSVWYFSSEDRITSRKVIRLVDPVAYAITSTFKFHLGTLALSSALVTPIEWVRSFFVYLEDKNDYDSNPVTEMLAKCCCCCIWIFKSCLKFICKEAFYVTAIQGSSFYPSAKLASTLIGSNLLRIGALSRVGYASVLLGKLIVCTVTCLIGWLLLQDISSPLLPVLAILVFSYGVAHAFMTIYETTVNMLLLCFTLDENMHGGRGNAAYAPAPLIQSVNHHLRPKWQTVL